MPVEPSEGGRFRIPAEANYQHLPAPSKRDPVFAPQSQVTIVGANGRHQQNRCVGVDIYAANISGLSRAYRSAVSLTTAR